MNEGTAIPVRIAIGMIVHRISIRVLWVVRDGVGFDFALKRTITVISRASTNNVMATMIQSRKS